MNSQVSPWSLFPCNTNEIKCLRRDKGQQYLKYLTRLHTLDQRVVSYILCFCSRVAPYFTSGKYYNKRLFWNSVEVPTLNIPNYWVTTVAPIKDEVYKIVAYVRGGEYMKNGEWFYFLSLSPLKVYKGRNSKNRNCHRKSLLLNCWSLLLQFSSAIFVHIV